MEYNIYKKIHFNNNQIYMYKVAVINNNNNNKKNFLKTILVFLSLLNFLNIENIYN